MSKSERSCTQHDRVLFSAGKSVSVPASGIETGFRAVLKEHGGCVLKGQFQRELVRWRQHRSLFKMELGFVIPGHLELRYCEAVKNCHMLRAWQIALLAIVAFLVAGACFYGAGYVPGTIRKNADGSFLGTGTAVYRYKNGAVMLEDYYRAGRLKHSKWYKPNGNVIAETSWNRGTNVGYYLREDGTIRVKMPYLDERANGTAIYYKEDGVTVDHVEQFRDGVPVQSGAGK